MNTSFFDYGAMLCQKIDSVEKVKDFILSSIPGEEQTYLSSYTPY